VKKLLRVQRRDESYAAAFSSTIAFGDTSYTQASIKPPQSERNINGPKRSSSVVSTIHSSSGKPRRKARQTTVDTSVTGKTNRLTGQKSTLEYSGKNLEKKARLKHCKREVSGRQEYGLARTTPARNPSGRFRGMGSPIPVHQIHYILFPENFRLRRLICVHQM